MTIYATSSILVYVFLNETPDMYNENITLFRGILVVRAIVKIMIDIYMFKQFLTLFFYLVERKVDMIEE